MACIARDEGVQRKDYALPLGTPAVQQDPVRSRRLFLFTVLGGAAVAGAIGFTGGYRVGVSRAGERQTESNPPRNANDASLAWAQKIARGPIADLVENHAGFGYIFDRREDDPQLWQGMQRLAIAALQQAADAKLARRVLTSIEKRKAPAAMAELIPLLEQKGGIKIHGH